jgi:hypothetical protein
MADHAREQIRDKVVAKVTGLTTTGTRVYPSRKYPLDDDLFPGLCVYTLNEVIDEEEGKLAGIQFRSVDIVIEGYDALVAGLDDKMGDIATEVETSLFADRFLTGSLSALDLVSTEVDLNVEAAKPVGMIKLTFKAQYLTAEGAPTVTL